MERLDKILQIAEELSNTRSKTENSLVNLRTHLASTREQIDVAINELEGLGIDASLSTLSNIEERAKAINRYVKEIKQLSATLDQALSYIKAAKKLTSH